jgi:hypothetical protein
MQARALQIKWIAIHVRCLLDEIEVLENIEILEDT